jgi:hypothetical protein
LKTGFEATTRNGQGWALGTKQISHMLRHCAKKQNNVNKSRVLVCSVAKPDQFQEKMTLAPVYLLASEVQ